MAAGTGLRMEGVFILRGRKVFFGHNKAFCFVCIKCENILSMVYIADFKYSFNLSFFSRHLLITWKDFKKAILITGRLIYSEKHVWMLTATYLKQYKDF